MLLDCWFSHNCYLTHCRVNQRESVSTLSANTRNWNNLAIHRKTWSESHLHHYSRHRHSPWQTLTAATQHAERPRTPPIHPPLLSRSAPPSYAIIRRTVRERRPATSLNGPHRTRRQRHALAFVQLGRSEILTGPSQALARSPQRRIRQIFRQRRHNVTQHINSNHWIPE